MHLTSRRHILVRSSCASASSCYASLQTTWRHCGRQSSPNWWDWRVFFLGRVPAFADTWQGRDAARSRRAGILQQWSDKFTLNDFSQHLFAFACEAEAGVRPVASYLPKTTRVNNLVLCSRTIAHLTPLSLQTLMSRNAYWTMHVIIFDVVALRDCDVNAGSSLGIDGAGADAAWVREWNAGIARPLLKTEQNRRVRWKPCIRLLKPTDRILRARQVCNRW